MAATSFTEVARSLIGVLVDATSISLIGVLVDATSIGLNHTIKEVESTKVETTANELVASHTMGATTLSAGYGEIKDGNKYTTVGAEIKLGDSFSLYGAFQQTDVPTGVDTQDAAAGIKFTF